MAFFASTEVTQTTAIASARTGKRHGPVSLYFALFAGALQMGCIDPGLLGVREQSQDEGDGGTSADDPTTDEADPGYPDAEDGTCSAWKFAYCDAVAACSAFQTREDCELDLGWLVCKSDAPLASCQSRIEKAVANDACEDLPTDCDPDEIADRTLPTELCLNIHTEMCEFRFFCGVEISLDSCIESLNRSEPCDSFTSFLPTAVNCADAFSSMACDDPLPQVCVGSLRR